MRRTYISGPMRGYDMFNFPAFFEAEKYIREQLKRDVVNPAREDMEKAGFNPFFDEPTEAQIKSWLARDLEDISTVEEMILLPGWKNSLGVKKELAHYLHERPRNQWRVWTYDPKAPPNYRLKGMMPVELFKYNTPPEETSSTNDLLLELQEKVEEAQREWLPGVEPANPQTIPEAYFMSKGYIQGRKEIERHGDLGDTFPPFAAPSTGEVRTTSETGGQKGVKPERWDLLPWDELAEVARLYGYGATKYEDRNWEKGYEWSKSFAALQRHILAWWDGEDDDPEHKLSHLTSVVFHALALMRFRQYPQYDDRPRRPSV